MNHSKLTYDTSVDAPDVTLENVSIGMQVARGRQWNRQKWRDDVIQESVAPKRRSVGTIIGYTNEKAQLVGSNTRRKYPTDRITDTNGPGWACVKWTETAKMSIYPIGAENVWSLVVRK